ncbi:hypothetical protein HMPREF1871_00579 [Gemelliphila asaccharolytica]|uniref:Uncharacterized protein n=1 Tax=Gemelliphila asaccharolytica TaxID=502393 RepID=A0ABR5TMX1_9BACL|nr:hypothetical protein HMPREF1871_00579 [Gemella asaccharolytica]
MNFFIFSPSSPYFKSISKIKTVINIKIKKYQPQKLVFFKFCVDISYFYFFFDFKTGLLSKSLINYYIVRPKFFKIFYR